jgi:macrolide-specific efflux system membrane fusion protein
LHTSRSTTDQELLAARTARARTVAQLAAARAAQELARISLDHTMVRAPLDGVVASVSTHEGETVASSFSAPTFVTIVDPTRLECVAIVDETDIGRVRVGQPAEFTVDAYPGRTFSGTVTRVAPDATIIGGVVDYEVTIRITSPLDGLKPQMTANVTVAVDSRRALVVPTAAVRQATDGLYVWRVSGGAPRRATVTAGARQLDVTEIRGGLAAGDTVLTGGFPETEAPR